MQNRKFKAIILFYDKMVIYVTTHRVLVQMEGTAHIDLSRFETTEAITFKILSVMHM